MRNRSGRVPAPFTFHLLGLLLLISLPASSPADSLTWSGFLGGSGLDEAAAACFDDAGLPVIAGATRSGDFPGATPAVSVLDTPASDAYVARFSADGATLLWCRVFGGGGHDAALALRANGSGGLIVAGSTHSPDFPVTPGGFDTEHGGHADLFIAELDMASGEIRWCSFLGGDGVDLVCPDLLVDGRGDIVVAGSSGSADFPVAIGVDAGGATDAFVSKIAADGSRLLWSARLGGGAGDLGLALARADSGDLLLGGSTRSADFPTTAGAWDRSLGGGGDAYVARLDDRGRLLWCTFLGGDDPDARESVTALACDRAGRPVVAGATSSRDFPAVPWLHAHQPDGDLDGFCAALSATGERLIRSALFGGGGDERVESLLLDQLDRPLIAGSTGSRDFPTTPGAIAHAHGGGETDAFLVRLASEGGRPLWSSYLGGGGDDHGFALAAGRPGVFLLAGLTDTEPGAPFPSTPGVYDTTPNGRGDAFLCRVAFPAVGTGPRATLSDSGPRVLPTRPGPRPEIRFLPGRSDDTSLSLFDTAGRRVRTLHATGPIGAGERVVVWDGRDDAGRPLPAGVYLARTGSARKSGAGKVLLLK